MRRTLGVGLAVLLALVLFYVSPFWPFRLWSRDGLLGIDRLRPQGDVVGIELRGTELSVFDLMIWAILGFLLLSAVQWIWRKLTGG